MPANKRATCLNEGGSGAAGTAPSLAPQDVSEVECVDNLPEKRPMSGVESQPNQPGRTRRAGRGRRRNGEGTVRARLNGTYEVRVPLGGGRYKSLYGKTEREVLAKLRTAQRQQEQGLDLGKASKWTVGAWLDHWLAQIISQREPTTRASYATIVRLHIEPKLGKVLLAKLSVEHIERWLSDLATQGVGASTRRDALTRLRTALKLAERRGHIIRNVASLVELPPVHRRQRPAPEPDRVRRLLEAAHDDPRLHAFVLVGVGAGLRRAEAMGLQWGDVDLEAGRISVRRRVNRITGRGLLVRPGAKSRAGERTVYVAPMVMDAFRRLSSTLQAERHAAGGAWCGADDPAAPDAFVFVTGKGTLLEPRNLGRSFDAACRRAGIKPPKDPAAPRGTKSGTDFHGLRHDFASMLGDLGVPQHVAMRMVGHSQPSMTGYYQHAGDAAQREAAVLVDGWLRQAVGG